MADEAVPLCWFKKKHEVVEGTSKLEGRLVRTRNERKI